jgi:hypothetical protein
MILKNSPNLTDLLTRQSGVVGQGYIRRQPELRFPIGTRDVDVQPVFFTGKEIEAIAAVSKDGGAHLVVSRDDCPQQHPIEP